MILIPRKTQHFPTSGTELLRKHAPNAPYHATLDGARGVCFGGVCGGCRLEKPARPGSADVAFGIDPEQGEQSTELLSDLLRQKDSCLDRAGIDQRAPHPSDRIGAKPSVWAR